MGSSVMLHITASLLLYSKAALGKGGMCVSSFWGIVGGTSDEGWARREDSSCCVRDCYLLYIQHTSDLLWRLVGRHR
jgi:hypothetical protein